MVTMVKKRKATKNRTDEIFGEIVSGTNEAIAYANGTADRKAYKVHIPEQIDVKALRKGLKMSQAAFAACFGFSAARIRDWEQERSAPDPALRAYLMVIKSRPEIVEEVLCDNGRGAAAA